MISDEVLTETKDRITKSIEVAGIQAEFDHFAIKVPDSKTYKDAAKYYGQLVNEVFQSGRNIATVVGPLGTFEIMEPKPTEDYTETHIDHLGFVENDLNAVTSVFPKIVNKLKIGNTEIQFIKNEDDLIQFRTIPLTDFKPN